METSFLFLQIINSSFPGPDIYLVETIVLLCIKQAIRTRATPAKDKINFLLRFSVWSSFLHRRYKVYIQKKITKIQKIEKLTGTMAEGISAPISAILMINSARAEQSITYGRKKSSTGMRKLIYIKASTNMAKTRFDRMVRVDTYPNIIQTTGKVNIKANKLI